MFASEIGLRSQCFVVAAILFAGSLVVGVGCSATNKLTSFLGDVGLTTEAPTPLGWSTSHVDSAAEANASGKVLMLWFTGSDWCPPCMKLESEIFHSAEFQSWYPEQIVPVILDFPKRSKLAEELSQQNQFLATKYQIKRYPTALFIDQQGNVIGKLGYEEGGPSQWITKAKVILGGAG